MARDVSFHIARTISYSSETSSETTIMNSMFGNIVFDLLVIGIGFGLFCVWQFRRIESIKRNHQPSGDTSKSMRGMHLKSIANKYRMRFDYRLDKPIDDQLASLELFAADTSGQSFEYSVGGRELDKDTSTSSLRFGNVMTGTIGDVQLQAFDHFFLPDCPEIAQTVLVIKSPEFKFPKFTIKQTGTEHEIQSNDPEHKLIFRQLLTQLPPHSFNLWLEGHNDTLVICNQNSTVATHDFDQFMDIGMDLLEIFAPSMSEPVAS